MPDLHRLDAISYGLYGEQKFFIQGETKVNPDKKWIVMHENADKPVCDGGGRILYFADQTAAFREAERLTEIDRCGASYYVLARVAKVSPVAKTKTVAL